MFYDSHAHCLRNQDGGFLIALEGKPVFPETCDNQGIVDLMNTLDRSRFFPVYYIDKEMGEIPSETIIKYHPRREGYSPEAMINDIKGRDCKIIVIDTLGQPNWQPMDYWNVVRTFPEKRFLLSHAGGYDILEFVKILDFTKNVYLDFSMTQEYFGWCGGRARLNAVADCIDYCLNNKRFEHKILLGSDEPFFSQEKALEMLRKYNHFENISKNNFESLVSIL